MNAIDAKNAKQRARIATHLFKTVKPWPNGFGLGNNRGFDNCFEMNDGNQVKRHLLVIAMDDTALRTAMRIHGYGKWADEAERFTVELEKVTA